jgi:hypothetical protein
MEDNLLITLIVLRCLVKCGDLIQCQETRRLALVLSAPGPHGWIKIRWVDDGVTMVVQNIAWKNITKKDKKCP